MIKYLPVIAILVATLIVACGTSNKFSLNKPGIVQIEATIDGDASATAKEYRSAIAAKLAIKG